MIDRATVTAYWESMSRVERGTMIAMTAAMLLLVGGMGIGTIAPAYLAYLIGLGAMYALLSLGLNAQWGYTGLINFSVAAFFGIGAYGTALMTADSSPIAGGFNPIVGLFVALVLAAVLAILIGIPTLRLRADYLAIASLGLAEVVRLLALNERQLTNGSAGVRGVPSFFEGWPILETLPSTLPQLTFAIIPGRPIVLGSPFYQAFLDLSVVGIFLVASYFVLKRVHRSPWGRILRTIRSDEDLAKALGKNTYSYKMQSFVFGSLIMALAGVFAAHLTRFVNPGTLDPLTTFYVWVAVMLGGSGSNRGALLGGFVIVTIREGTRFFEGIIAFVLDLLPQLAVDALFGLIGIINTVVPLVNLQTFPEAGSLRLFIIGLLIILVMRYRPQGLLPPQKELIWPGTVDETPSTVDTGVREARGGQTDE